MTNANLEVLRMAYQYHGAFDRAKATATRAPPFR
jgi:hypothetical protein